MIDFSVFRYFSSAVGIACSLAYFVIMIVLHVRDRGVYDPVSHAVSDYGVGPSRPWFLGAGAMTLLRNLSLLLVMATWPAMEPIRLRSLILLALSIVGHLGVAIFPTDLEGSKRTVKGLTHLSFAVLQFTAVAIFIFDSESRLSSLIPSCMGLVGVLMVVVRIGLYGLVAAMILPLLKRFFGLLERTYLYSANLYLLLLAVFAFAH